MKRYTALVAILLPAFVMLLASCEKQPEPEISVKDELVVFLDSLETRYEEACVATGIANWNGYSGDGPANLDSAKALFTGIFLDSAARSTIRQWRNKSGSLADPLLGRRLDLWHRCFVGGSIYANPDVSRLENELQKLFVDFHFSYGGKPITRAEVRNRIRDERNQNRRHRLWRVNSQLSAAAAGKLGELVRLRNRLAVEAGFGNYYSLSLNLQAIDEAWLISTLDRLERQTRGAFASFIEASAARLKVPAINAWDFERSLKSTASIPDRYFPADSVFSVIHRFERTIGFPVDSLPIRETVRDIPYGGLSLGIVIPTDSRFLVNPTRGKAFYATAFHEYGHSLKAVNVDVPYPILKGYEWIPGAQCAAYEEGVAELHAEFTEDTAWIAAYSNTPEHIIQDYAATRHLSALYRTRRLLKDFFFEYEMYRDPDRDLDSLEREMFRKYLLVELPEDEPPSYASSIWYVSYPCYYQNYILSSMIATQLQEALSDKFGRGKLTDSTVAPWMIEHLYRDGEKSEWTDRVRHATGKSLETGAFLRKLSIDPERLAFQDARHDSGSN